MARVLDIQFPAGGLNKALAYQQQPPYTTISAMNVKPRETYEGRLRGGSRPGLVLEYSDTSGLSILGPPAFLVSVVPYWTGLHAYTGFCHERYSIGSDRSVDSPPWVPIRLEQTDWNASKRPRVETISGTTYFVGADYAGVGVTVADDMFLGPFGDMDKDTAYTIIWAIYWSYNASHTGTLSYNFYDRMLYDKASEHIRMLTDNPGGGMQINFQIASNVYTSYPVLTITLYRYSRTGSSVSYGPYTFNSASNDIEWTNPMYVTIESGAGSGAYKAYLGPASNMQTVTLFNESGVNVAHQVDSSYDSRTVGITLEKAYSDGVHRGRCTYVSISQEASLALSNDKSFTVYSYGGRIYRETDSDTLSLVSFPEVLAPDNWLGNTKYSVGDWVKDITATTEYYFQCVVPGISGSSTPSWVMHHQQQTTDGTGTLTWEAYHVDKRLLIRSDVPIGTVTYNGKVYIADYGDSAIVENGSGTIASSQLSDDTSGFGNVNPSTDVIVITNHDNAKEGVYVIKSVDSYNQLTIDETGIDTTSTPCTYKIVRSPKIYDPVRNVLLHWLPSSGNGIIPTGCPIIAAFQDRLFLAGEKNNQHIWYACAAGDPTDWDFADTLSGASPGAAVAGTTGGAGQIGDPITAMIVYSEDYMLIANREKLFIMRGDPTMGGGISLLSHSYGVISREAWCYGPEGEVIYLSPNGVCFIPAGGLAVPQLLSDKVLPEELVDVDIENTIVTMAYDPAQEGIYIFLTDTSDDENPSQHWFIDWKNKSFWPIQFGSADLDPVAVTRHIPIHATETKLLMATRDGRIVSFDDTATDDDGDSFSSYVWLGPFRPGGSDSVEGILKEIDCVLDDSSDDVAWEIYVGDTIEEAKSAAIFDSGTFSADRSYLTHVRARGAACFIKLSATGRWAMERLKMAIEPVARFRKL